MNHIIDSYLALSQMQRVGFAVFSLIWLTALVFLSNVLYQAIKSLIIRLKKMLQLIGKIMRSFLMDFVLVILLIIGTLILPLIYLVKAVTIINNYFDNKRKKRIIEETLLVERTRREFRRASED